MKNETRKVTFRIPLALHRRLSEAMWARRTNMTEVLIEAVREYCERHALPDPGAEEVRLPEQSVISEDTVLPWEDL